MKPTILLIGANGQIGHELSAALPRVGEVTALGRQQLDLAQPAEIRRAIREFRPALIVNAAAYTAVDRAESEAALARAVNADAPAVMAEEAKQTGAAFIHYSTDYVFDGTKTTPYEEDDLPNPLSVYGLTKLEGERAIQASGVAHLIFRTSWVYATRGRNFLLAVLRRATEREELHVVRDQAGAPTSAREIARATAQILTQLSAKQPGRISLEGVSGVYHVTAAGETTWYEYAKSILAEAVGTPAPPSWFQEATGGLPLIARSVVPITAAEYIAPARRPGYSVLSNARLARTFSVQLPEWRKQLHSVFKAEAAREG
jgi:dTDP-4-dehydrorhamnose reductase